MSGKLITIEAVGSGSTPGGGSVTYPTTQARVSADHGVDGLGQIGDYNLPFKSVSAAVASCRAAISATPSLAAKLVVEVEAGTYATESDWVFAGIINLLPGTIITTAGVLFEINLGAFSGLPDQLFQVKGNGHISGADFIHNDQSDNYTMVLECDYLQFNSMDIASEFVLNVKVLNVTAAAQLHLVDSVSITIGRIEVAAGIDITLFTINPASIPGRLVNNASTIHVKDLEVKDTSRITFVNFTGTQERHTIDIRVDSAQGCAIICGGGLIAGDMTANFLYKAQFGNALSAADSSFFNAQDNAVINVKADITNFSYLNSGTRFSGRGNSFVSMDIRLVSYSSLRAVYIECFDQSTVTLNGTVDAYSAGSQVGIYIYAPYEAPFDNTDNASNLYFQNVSLRNMNTELGGVGLWCWNGANHKVNILGTYSLVGLWSVEKESRISYKYNTILPVSAEKTREMVIATDGQTIFPSMYKLWDSRLTAVMNGLILQGDDYTLTGTDLTLGLAAFADDEIVLENFDAEPVIYEMTEWGVVGEGIKLIGVNNEYMSSPAGDYFGSSIQVLDIEVQLNNFTQDDNKIAFILGQGSIFSESSVNFYHTTISGANNLFFKIYENGIGVLLQIDYPVNITSIENSNIKVKGRVGFVDLIIDGVVVISQPISNGDIIPDLSTRQLLFNIGGTIGGSPFTDYIPKTSQYSYIKINSHEWTFPEGTGATTTNSQGVVTTLNSDVGVEPMWLTGKFLDTSIVLPPISFITPPTDPTINAILTGPDTSGDGVKYTTIPNVEDPTAYLSYDLVQDTGKILQLISVRFSARVEDIGDSPVIVKVQVSNDLFVSNWESPEFEFTTASYVTKEWYLSGRLFSPDKNTSSGINVRVLIYHNVAGTAQGILFNNFKLKGYHKI